MAIPNIRGFSCGHPRCCSPQGAEGTCTQDKQLCCKYRSKNPMASRRIFLLAAR